MENQRIDIVNVEPVNEAIIKIQKKLAIAMNDCYHEFDKIAEIVEAVMIVKHAVVNLEKCQNVLLELDKKQREKEKEKE